MAIVLYREGDTHTVRGVQCEMGRFDLNEMQTMLDKGWKKSPDDLVEEVVDEQDQEQSNPDAGDAEEDNDAIPLDEADLPALKEYATQIGVKFAANIGEAKLREKVRQALEK